MRLVVKLGCVLALLLLSGGAASGQVPDLVGGWDLEMQVLLGGEELACVYGGSCQITSQDGAQFVGTADLELTSGPASCPPMMSASISGEWTQNGLVGTLDGGEAFGMAFFNGNLGQVPATTVVAKAAPGTTYSGPFNVPDGEPFQGESGTWSAVARGVAVLQIPSLGPAGLTALILLLLVGGSWLLVRSRLV